MLAILSLVVEFLPHQIYILSPILSSEIQTNSTYIFTPVDISTWSRWNPELLIPSLKPFFSSGFFISSEKTLLSYKAEVKHGEC